MDIKIKVLFLVFLLVTIVNTYQTCPTITLKSQSTSQTSYKYSLQLLKTSDNILTYLQSNIIRISPCQLKSCEKNTSIKGFMIGTNNSTCQSYTLNHNPLVENYQMINSSAPGQGIKISFLPLRVDNNGSWEYYQSILEIKCKLSSDPSSTTTCNQTKINNKTTLTCKMSHQSGCPTISQNYFWEFLAKSHLAFAITIWVISIIQLFLGYFIIRITIALFGILTGLVIGVVCTAQGYTDFIAQNDTICIVVIVLSLLIGVFYGIALLTLPRLGYVNIGLWVALVIGLLIQNAVLFLSGGLLGFYILTGILALIMIVVALLAMRFFIIVSTSFLSAFGLIRPLGFFLQSYPNQLNVGHTSSTPWQYYLYLLAIIVITILGSVFQFCLLKKKGKGNANGGYYLQQDSPIRQKLKKLMEFQQIKRLAKAGKDQVLFFKNLIVEKSQNNLKSSLSSRNQEDDQDKDSYIEMQKVDLKKNNYSNDQSSQKQNKNTKNKIKVNKKKEGNSSKNISYKRKKQAQQDQD